MPADPAVLLKQMEKRLGLSADQLEKVRAVLEEGRQARQAITGKYVSGEKTMRDLERDERQAMRRELQSVQQANDAKLEEILSAEQLSGLVELRREMMERARERREAAGGQARPKKD